MAVGAKSVLEYNLCPELGLFNSCTGIVKDIFYRKTVAEKPSVLPKYCWVYINEYLVILTFLKKMKNVKNGFLCILLLLKNILLLIKLYLEQYFHYSLLGRGLFSQGQTICTKIILNLGSKEKEHGLSYVAFLRATK